MSGQPYTRRHEATHEQESQLDRLCIEHGTLEVALVPIRGLGVTMHVQAGDGYTLNLDEQGRPI